MPEEHPPWPEVPQKAFDAGPRGVLNACVQWVLQRDDCYGYIEGYRRAAETLAEQVCATGASVDMLVFPIAFMWRHYLEVALKELVAMSGTVSAEEQRKLRHDLELTWLHARPVIAALGPDAAHLDNVEAVIKEFDTVDADGYGFRYPRDIKGATPSLPAAPKLINIERMHETMRGVANFLGVARSMLVQLRRPLAAEGSALNSDEA